MEIEHIFGNLPKIETSRLILRKIRIQDIEDMHEYTSNENVSKYVTWEPHQTIADTKSYIHFVLNQYDQQRIAPWGVEFKENKKLIGTIDFVSWQPVHRTAEIGYAISQEYWGRGLTTEAVQALIKFGFTHMDILRIEARCMSENIASEHVMKKNGMILEGVIRKGLFIKGKHRDLKLYSILKEEFEPIQNSQNNKLLFNR